MEKSCETCKHNNKPWDSEVCDGCTKADSNYEADLIGRRDAIDCVRWGNSVTNVIDKINALPSAGPKTGWIPVSERLPEKDGKYLICTNWDYPDMDVYRWADGWNCIRLVDGKVDREDEIDGANIIVWMPLPELYREDSEV